MDKRMIASLSAILLLEGRRAGASSLAPALAQHRNLGVTVVHTASAARASLAECSFDLIVYDASTMRTSGVRTCQRLKAASSGLPIIHCRSNDISFDHQIGADVYLLRPFTARKLTNRIRSLLPANDLTEPIVRAGCLTFFPLKRSVDVAGKGEHRLTPKLASMLEQFLRHPNEVMGRERLMKSVWKTSYVGDTRTLDVHVRWMREIIEDDPASPTLLRTIRGVGYIFSVPPKLDTE
jgi:two-component system, OmpR family, phosphate regulon response regulator PhoB